MLNKVNISNEYHKPLIVVSGLFILLNLWVKLPLVISTIAFLILAVSVSYQVGRVVFPKQGQGIGFVFGNLLVSSVAIILMTATYFVWRVDASVFTIIVLILLALACWLPMSDIDFSFKWRESRTRLSWLSALIILGDLFLMTAAIIYRTDFALQTPWYGFSASFFVIYGLVTLALLLRSFDMPGRGSVALTILHFFTTYSVALFVYKLGYGFDPFIHRAAEEFIAENGALLPKNPYYLGQYVRVVFIAAVTNLPVFFIDQIIVPFFSAILLPIVGYFSLTKHWLISKPSSATLLSLFLIIPLAPLTFTIPFNFTVLIFILTLLLIPAIKSDNRIAALMIVVNVSAVLTHPMLAVVSFLITLLAWGSRLVEERNIFSRIGYYLVTIVLIAVSTPALFVINNIRQGLPWFNFTDLGIRSVYFTSLFRDPYTLYTGQTSWYWEALYNYRQFIPIIFTVLALLCGTAWLIRRVQKNNVLIFAVLAGLWVNVYFVSTLFAFQGVIYYEQQEFAYRLLMMITVVTVPILIMAAARVIDWRKWTYGIIFTLIAVLATAGWYLTYPQLNEKVNIHGWSVSQDDIEAVNLIEEISDGEPYLVLSNQMMSAAALQEIGYRYFDTTIGEIYFYALPTGDALYQFFLSMVYQSPRRETVDEIFSATGVEKVYFVVHYYWPNASYTSAAAKETSDAVYSVGDDQIMIFEYNK